jgi:hypothetical protein
MKIAFVEHEQHRKVMTLCRFYPGQIFFPQWPLRRHHAVVVSIKNERIEHQVIRVAGFARASRHVRAKRLERTRGGIFSHEEMTEIGLLKAAGATSARGRVQCIKVRACS